MAAARGAPGTRGDRDMAENPVVNPIIGPGRGANQVRTELRAHHDELRKEDPLLVFSGDYLLLRVGPQRSAMVLARVCHVPYGGATTDESLIEVTEYYWRRLF